MRIANLMSDSGNEAAARITENEEDDDNAEESDNDSLASKKNTTARRPIPRPLQIKAVQSLSDDCLFSSRVNAVLDVLRDIFQVARGEKVIVASRFVVFLDVLEEAMKRRHPDVLMSTFSGYLSNREQAQPLERFRTENSFRVLFLSATAGGTGINLTIASRLIICEPAWTPGALEQLKGRVYRLSQKRPVFIYDVVGDSSVDK